MALARKVQKKTIEVDADDIAWIKQSLSTINTSISNLNLSVNGIEKTTIKLNTTIVGDKDYGQIGLISKVEENSDYIEKDKAFKAKLIGGSFVLGGLWTILIKFWDKIF
jgi:aminopeptidase-like protein